MSTMIELIDTITGKTATVPVDDVAEQLRRWYGLPMTGDQVGQDVLDKVDEFQAALLAGAFEARELAAYLAVGFYEVQEAPGR